MQHVFAVFRTSVFQLELAHVPMLRDPPPEMFARIGWDTMRAQYVVLRAEFIPALLQEHGSSRPVRMGLDEAALYALIMRQPYSTVHSAGIWHVLRLYHRLVMAGASTEQLAEGVGSMLTQQARGTGGCPPPLADTLNAVRLRSMGMLEGDSMSFIRRGLDVYFRKKPWHFSARS